VRRGPELATDACEQLEVGFRIATMYADWQGTCRNFATGTDLARRPAEQGAVEPSGDIDIGNPKLDVRRLS
jgi:hypothetical protein